MTRPVRACCGVLLAAGMIALFVANAKPVSSPIRYAASAAARTVQSSRYQSQGSVNPNTASVEELTALYGVGPKLAQAILAEREENGPFDYWSDLTTVKGIGKKKLDGFRDQLANVSPQP